MAKPIPGVADALDVRVEELGFELVEIEWAGSVRRPILRLRVDRPGESALDSGVSLEDCVTVSRGLEPWLDEHESVPEKYVLEVSSPGVDRALVRAHDFDRFAGQWVAVKGRDVLAGKARRLEGELLGLVRDEGREIVRLRNNSGEFDVPRDEIVRANVVYRWE